MTKRLALGVSAAAMLAMGFAPVAPAAETKGPVTDEIGVVEIPDGAPIVIGGYWTLSGPDTALGLDQKRSVEIAFDEIGNELAGHPIQFIAEDSQCNAEGGQVAATKLASIPDVVAVLGPDCSSSATPGAPILWNAGIVDVGTSTTAPSLTAADRSPEYFGFLRTVYSDADAGRFDAQYFREVLQCQTLATIHDGSPYAAQLAKTTADNFRELGGEVVAEEAVAPTDVDMRPVLTGIAAKSPCVLYYPIFVAAAAQITRQAPDIPGLENTKTIGSSALMAPGFLEAAGAAAVGFEFTNADTTPEAMGAKYPAFVEAYQAKFGELPIQAFHANAYDGAQILIAAIEKTAVTDDAGTTYIGRKALRDALFAIKGYEGISGEMNCDEHGQCAGYKFAVYRFTDADPATFDIGTNPEKIYP
ncbi:MAG TPA: branched-chain amino acid ABC transporter substrate-binding protein [Geminicoccaceae bacterium]|nr:branched-chain amino acid ABC transporter substrate-binding protein [Geminicoccaceae bacterium]